MRRFLQFLACPFMLHRSVCVQLTCGDLLRLQNSMKVCEQTMTSDPSCVVRTAVVHCFPALTLPDMMHSRRTKEPFSGVEQAADSDLRNMQQRLEATEMRQHHMMAFLAKAVNDPMFLQQFLSARQANSRITDSKCDSPLRAQQCRVVIFYNVSRLRALASLLLHCMAHGKCIDSECHASQLMSGIFVCLCCSLLPVVAARCREGLHTFEQEEDSGSRSRGDRHFGTHAGLTPRP
jgi:hypothetical protein